MLINRHQTVSLSLISTDLPVWEVIETTASVYQRNKNRFHLLIEPQNLPHSHTESNQKDDRGLVWLEISPYRVTLTMQSNGKLSYRHYWERGIYGVSRYCLSDSIENTGKSLHLRNFTRHLKLDSDPVFKSLRIEYEIWSSETRLGSYVFHLNVI